MKKKFKALLSICLAACMLITMMPPLAAEAASKTNAKMLTITAKDVKNGVVTVPKGNYSKIVIAKEAAGAKVNLKNVTVAKLQVKGSKNANMTTINLKGSTSIGTLLANRTVVNGIEIPADSKAKISVEKNKNKTVTGYVIVNNTTQETTEGAKTVTVTESGAKIVKTTETVTDASGEVVNQVETVTDEFGRTARYIYESIKDFKDTLDQQSEFYLYENTSLVINNQILFGTSDDALVQYRYVGDGDGEPIGILNYFRNDNMICLRCYYDECRLVDETYDGELVTLDNGKRKIEVQVSISGKPLKEGSIATGGPRCFKSGNVDTGESYDVFGLFLVADAEKENLTYTIDGKKATPIKSSLNGDHSFVVMFDRTGLSIGKHKVVVKTKSGKYKKYVATVTITKENVVYSK